MIQSTGEIVVALKSDLGHIVSSDEITKEKQRDLGVPIHTLADRKLKGIAIPDDTVHPADADDDEDGDSDDDDDAPDGKLLAQVLQDSRGSAYGSSSKFNADKVGQQTTFNFSGLIPDHILALRKQQWDSYWHDPKETISFEEAHAHVRNAVSNISTSELKDHLIATTLLTKGLKSDIFAIKPVDPSVLTGIQQALATAAKTSHCNTLADEIKEIKGTQSTMIKQLESLDSRVSGIEGTLQQILSIISGNEVKKGEKVIPTKCSPDPVLRSNKDGDDNSGNDGRRKKTSDAAMVQGLKKSQAQSETVQSTHVSSSGVKTVRTLVKSQILTEEQQILTGDQFLMPGQNQFLKEMRM